MTNNWEFNSVFKLYLFKNKNSVSLGIFVSPVCVNTYDLSVNDFDKIMEFWDQKGGVEVKTNNNSWHVQHKTRGSRPECLPTDFVKLSVYAGSQSFHYRVTYKDMINLQNDYNFQKNNKMYWDEL